MSDHHPVDDLGQWEFDSAATFAAFQLRHIGFSYCTLSPGDGTRYDFAILRPPTNAQWDRFLRQRFNPDGPEPCRFNNEGRYLVATQFGRLYGWGGTTVRWTYAFEKWTAGRAGTPDEWTARVTARFLSALADQLSKEETE